jgi:hypothetical protein
MAPRCFKWVVVEKDTIQGCKGFLPAA